MTLRQRLIDAKLAGTVTATVAYFGRFEGPDHLYPGCPALRRTVPWRQPWPARTVDLVDPDGGDLCGWCVRVWRSRGDL